jgi:hypothetical protein
MSLMKSLDRQSLDEQTRLVSRYVAGDLSRSERAEFEAWLVASPELASEVEMERRMRRGIASAARRGWLTRQPGSQSIGRERRWSMAIAASVAVALTTIGLSLVMPVHHDEETRAVTGSDTMQSGESRSVLPALPRIVRLRQVRGMETTPDVSYALNAVPSELRIEPDVVVFTCPDGSLELECVGGLAPQTPQYPEYEMELVNRRGSVLAWQSTRQLPSSTSPLSFVLGEPEKLGPGDYDMIVRGHSPEHEEVVARFWLRVTAQ